MACSAAMEASLSNLYNESSQKLSLCPSLSNGAPWIHHQWMSQRPLAVQVSLPLSLDWVDHRQTTQAPKKSKKHLAKNPCFKKGSWMILAMSFFSNSRELQASSVPDSDFFPCCSKLNQNVALWEIPSCKANGRYRSHPAHKSSPQSFDSGRLRSEQQTVRQFFFVFEFWP